MDENMMALMQNDALKGIWDSLTDEQKAKARECKNMDELMLLAGKMGIELPDEMLDNVAGGVIVQLNNGKYRLYGYRGPNGFGGARTALYEFGPFDATFDDLDTALKVAREVYIQDQAVVSEEEFEKRMNGGC